MDELDIFVLSGTIEDEYLLLSRTATMWGRLRQIYFDADHLPADQLRTQVSDVIQKEVLGLSEQEVYADLQVEVSEFADRVAKRRAPPDGMLPPPFPKGLKDNDNDDPDQASMSILQASSANDVDDMEDHA
jgi:hypothetical protein